VTETKGSPYSAAMREVTEPTPIDLQAFSTGRILKESWEICTKYFGALVMPMVVMTLLGVPFVFIFPGAIGDLINNIISACLGPIALMGLYRSTLALKSTGTSPSFSSTTSNGSEYWWRGIKIGCVIGLYTFCAVLCGILATSILWIPGILLLEEYKTAAIALFVFAGIGLTGFLCWFGARACLAYASMADERSIAFESFSIAWDMTKGRLGEIASIGLALAGIGLALLLMLSVFLALLFALDESIGVIALILLFIPGLLAYFFVLSWGHVALCLTYQALKPAPTEENQLPAN
jgi:hypothetical protein